MVNVHRVNLMDLYFKDLFCLDSTEDSILSEETKDNKWRQIHFPNHSKNYLKWKQVFSTTVSGNFSISLPGTECTEYIFRLNIHGHTHYAAYI